MTTMTNAELQEAIKVTVTAIAGMSEKRPQYVELLAHLKALTKIQRDRAAACGPVAESQEQRAQRLGLQNAPLGV